MKYVFTFCAVLFSAALFAQVNEAPPPPPPPPLPLIEEEVVFKVVEEMPRFPGCEDIGLKRYKREECAKQELLNYVYSNLQYPAQAKESAVEGMAVIYFNIKENGLIEDIRIVRDPGAGCGEAAKAVFDKMQADGLRWIPGKQRGRPVVVQWTMPVKFKLEE